MCGLLAVRNIVATRAKARFTSEMYQSDREYIEPQQQTLAG